jgi:hypothetical protein
MDGVEMHHGDANKRTAHFLFLTVPTFFAKEKAINKSFQDQLECVKDKTCQFGWASNHRTFQ